MTRVFTSESVTEGHPDKICDQVSDAILDEILAQDVQSRVALETFITRGLCVVGGELTSTHIFLSARCYYARKRCARWRCCVRISVPRQMAV